MIEKLATLAIDKADGSLDLVAGEKGEIYQKARGLIRELNGKTSHDVLRIRAFFHGGVLKDYKFKANIVAVTSSVEASEEPDADILREALKAKGVKVPPRISLEKLVELAVENGVEV